MCMMIQIIILSYSFLLFCCILVDTASVEQAPNDNDDNDDTCSLYLAPSLIPNAGWGIFAGQNYNVGDRLVRTGMNE